MVEISKLLEGLVILKKKKAGKVKQGKKPSHHRISFFSPLRDVTVRMLLTDFLQGTALNHWRWCGIEDNKCGSHALDH